MAKTQALLALADIVGRLEKSVKQVVDRKQMRSLGDFAVDLIVKRTRLGYAVANNLGTKQKLKKLSPFYIQFRTKYSNLSDVTTPSRSNLTLTGQMLDSMKVIKESKQSVTIGPSGRRFDSKFSNAKIADFQAEQGRPFNFISRLEFNQMVREYRRTFGDLLRKNKLLK